MGDVHILGAVPTDDNKKILRGKFFYSFKQFIWLRREKYHSDKLLPVHPRMFCKLDSGEIVEYTEMVPIEDLRDNLFAKGLCEDMFDDVRCLGYGWFHHFGEDVS